MRLEAVVFQFDSVFCTEPDTVCAMRPNTTRGKSLLKIPYVIFVILKSHDFFSVIFCDFEIT